MAKDNQEIDYKLGQVELRFANIIWSNEPLSSGELVKLALKELGWKKSTTYTILRRLCERNLFKNEDSIVTSLVSKDEFEGVYSNLVIEDSFDGSLPQFLSAFTKKQNLSAADISEIQKIIDNATSGKGE